MWISDPMPVTTSSITAVRRSTAKSQPIESVPLWIQVEVVFRGWVALKSNPMIVLSTQAKERTTLPIATALTRLLRSGGVRRCR